MIKKKEDKVIKIIADDLSHEVSNSLEFTDHPHRFGYYGLPVRTGKQHIIYKTVNDSMSRDQGFRSLRPSITSIIMGKNDTEVRSAATDLVMAFDLLASQKRGPLRKLVRVSDKLPMLILV